MHNHNHGDASCGHGKRHHHGHRGFKHPFAPGFGPHGFGGPGHGRARRGDIRAAVLRLLSEQPMHGYQIIQELSARSEGAWSPSAGSVYPTLQLLADEGLIVAQETAGKKVFSLTESGTSEVAKTADQPAPWEDAVQNDTGAAGYRDSAGRLMQAMFQVGKTGSADQLTAGIEIMNDARKKLYALLAQD